MAGKFNNVSYSGTDSYKYVERLVKSSRRVLIVSPYLDAHYAKFISNNSKGKDVYVISSSLEEQPKKILLRRRTNRIVLGLIISAMILGLILIATGHFLISAGLFIVAIISLYFLLTGREASNVKLKIPSRFVHAKMYIGSDMAIQGSANLTFKGMHKNVEHVEVIEDLEKIKELEKQFWNLWNGV